MLKLIKYELIKQRTSKVIIGAILALLEVAFLAGMLLGKEEIMAIAAGMLTFLASVTFVIVGLEEIITYYHDLRDKSGYMLFMTPYNVSDRFFFYCSSSDYLWNYWIRRYHHGMCQVRRVADVV